MKECYLLESSRSLSGKKKKKKERIPVWKALPQFAYGFIEIKKSYMSSLTEGPLAHMRFHLESMEMMQVFKRWPQYLYWEELDTYTDKGLELFFL